MFKISIETKLLARVSPSGWRHRQFHTSVVLQEIQLATIHRQDTSVKISEPRKEAKALPLLPEHREWEGPQQKVKRSSYTLTAPPLPQAGTVPQWGGFPEPIASPVGKKSRRWTSCSPSVTGYFPAGTLGSCLTEIIGKSVGLDHWGSDGNREGQWGSN